MHILIIEDEPILAEAIKTKLATNKYTVDIANDGVDGLLQAGTNIYDLIILDVMLPGMDGFEILKNLRDKQIQSKIIMLTARSTLEDKLHGLENGANDYLAKPFHMDELAARVKIQLTDPALAKTGTHISYGDLELNTSQLLLLCQTTGESVDLIRKESQLLEYLMNNPGCILSKEQIYNRIWGTENNVESNSLEAFLSFIRRKFRAIGSTVNIRALRGLGYKLEDKNAQTKN